MSKRFCIPFSMLIATTLALAFEPPEIISTSPVFWSFGVDSAKQKTISLTFNQPMRPGFSSWLGRSSLAPDSNSATTISEDRLTFNLAVGLQPGKVYVFGLNEKGIPGVGFQNDKGLSLAPTFLVFQTAGTPAPDDAPPSVLKTIPANGANGLDPTRLKSIVITFNRPMSTKKHGLHLLAGADIVDLSRARSEYSTDGKTFTLYYDFKPSQPYRLELNNVNDIGFASVNRVPLWPVQTSFTTGQPQ